MDLVVEGKDITVEAVVSDTLPQSVLLGVHVPELEDFMVHNRKVSDGNAFVATTRSRAKREQQEEEEQRNKHEESEVNPRRLVDEDNEDREDGENSEQGGDNRRPGR